jgi:parvulin-like peptidyl-prolyl isomerase
MSEQHLDTHRNLISVLLTYPDRASKVLNKHQQLIDANFIQQLEAVATKMAEAGNQAAAEFLENLAAQIRREFLSVVLQVGQETITASEIVSRLTRYQMLPQFLSEVIIDQALAPIQCSPEEQTKAYQRFYEQNQITDDNERQAWCQHNGLTQEQLEDLAIRPLKLQKFQQAMWGKKVESYFLERKEELDQVCYSLLRIKDGGLAQELYFRLEEGEQSFVEIARKYSQGPEAQQGGLIGPMSMKMPHPVIARILKSLKPGQISQPVRIEEWFIIVRLEKYIPAQLNETMRRRLLNELFQNWLSEQLSKQSINLFAAQSTNSSPVIPAAASPDQESVALPA